MNLNKILFASLSFAVLSLFGTASASDYYLHSPSGNARWTVMPADAVGNTEQLFTAGYSNPEEVEAVVPGTVFTSYVEAGREKDPNFGDNIHNVDRSKYDRSFWYRATFSVPGDFSKDYVWLNFRGINRRGDIYLNGTFLGTLDGFMHRGCFDVSKIVKDALKSIFGSTSGAVPTVIGGRVHVAARFGNEWRGMNIEKKNELDKLLK